MPSKHDHLKKARGNEAFALSIPLKDQTHVDWALVVLFYAAVHYVEAYLDTIGQHLRSHETRDNFAAKDSKLKKIFKNYADLKYYGYNARYEFYGFTAKDFTDVALKHLTAIKTHIEPLL